MSNTFTTAEEFRENWASGINFLMEDDCVPFSFDFPSTADIVSALQANPNMKAISGTISDHLEVRDAGDYYRSLSFEELLETSFQLTHFNIGEFDIPGQILYGFGETVMRPWESFLRENGFSWDRCYAIMRVSGLATVTGYHVDSSNVLFWNVRGLKHFHGLRNPEEKAPLDWALQTDVNQKGRPENIGNEDLLTIDTGDSQFIWNHIMTPHWVEAPELTFGINISHGGLRLNGRLAPREEAYYASKGWHESPDKIWRKSYWE